jgi:acetate CoA/acetoacetate CoA-transferase beta subunit
MQHTANGISKIVPECSLPITATRRVTLVVTELAVMNRPRQGFACGSVVRARELGVPIVSIMVAGRSGSGLHR